MFRTESPQLPQLTDEPEQVEWVTKEYAADALGKSVRTILEYAESNKIGSKKVPNPETGRDVLMLNAGDVARLRHEKENPPPRTSGKLRTGSPQSPQLAAPVEAEEQETPASSRREFLESIEAQPWLTLDQAAQFSGLTKRWLLQQAEGTAGIAPERLNPLGVRIIIRDMGKHSPSGRWRFHRGSLRAE